MNKTISVHIRAYKTDKFLVHNIRMRDLHNFD